VEKLLSGMKSKSFASRDEQEVAGYADAMDMIFESFESITPTENHIKQLHGVLLKYSKKNQEHRGHYKKVPNHVEAFGPDGKSLGGRIDLTLVNWSLYFVIVCKRRKCAGLEDSNLQTGLAHVDRLGLGVEVVWSEADNNCQHLPTPAS
jgi:hypothetical protein